MSLRAVEQLLDVDRRHRALLVSLESARAQRKVLSSRIAHGEDMADDMEESQDLKTKIRQLEQQERDLAKLLEEKLAEWPNLPYEDVPDGVDENHNREIRRIGKPREFAFTPKHHVELGEAMGEIDFASAARLSRARFVVLSGQLARLERALAAFMLDIHVNEFGYRECCVPHLVNARTIFNTGQLPKFADDLFHTSDGLWLIPTGEVPLTNLVADQILKYDDLPLRFTAYTPCYRREAGAAGKDTRGMLRQHQFSKVELVSITYPEDSDDELERMTQCAETILQRLDIPYRVMMLCAGDMGFAACKTYDIEVWIPKEARYREISSCSSCADFQARRMKARFRDQSGSVRYVHSLNGSGLAIGRAMIALLENHQQPDGSIYLPPPLRSYMGGCDSLSHA